MPAPAPDAVAPDPSARRRLGELVATRRSALGLSKDEAARRARITNTTWTRVEKGENVRDAKLAAVETVLGWGSGVTRDVLSGTEPDWTPDPSAPAGGVYVHNPETRQVADVPGAAVWTVDPTDEIERAVQDAVIGALPQATGADIREIQRRAVAELRRRGVLPPDGRVG